MTKCYNCRQAKMKVRRETYEYDLAGLPYPVVLLNVPVQRCPKCEEHAVTIPDLEGLHLRLALDIVSAPRLLLPEEIRFLRKTMDWTAEEMGRIVGVDVKTISRWENGKQRLGPVAERLLRLIVRDLEPRPVEWVSTVFSELAAKGPAKTRRTPPPVRFKTTAKGWERAA